MPFPRSCHRGKIPTSARRKATKQNPPRKRHTEPIRTTWNTKKNRKCSVKSSENRHIRLQNHEQVNAGKNHQKEKSDPSPFIKNKSAHKGQKDQTKRTPCLHIFREKHCYSSFSITLSERGSESIFSWKTALCWYEVTARPTGSKNRKSSNTTRVLKNVFGLPCETIWRPFFNPVQTQKRMTKIQVTPFKKEKMRK